LPAAASAAAQMHAVLGSDEPVKEEPTADPVQLAERQAKAVRSNAAPQDFKTAQSSAPGKNMPEDFRTVINRSVENSQNRQAAEQLQLSAEKTVPLVREAAANPAVQTAEPVFTLPSGRETEGDDGLQIHLVSPALTAVAADQPMQAEAAVSAEPARNSGSTGASLFNQVADSIELAWQGDRQIMRIRLKPDAFGDVQIRLSRDREGLTARISTDNTETHRLLTAQIGQLQDNLQEKGLNCRQIDIQLDAGTAGFRNDSGTARFQQPNDRQQGHSFDQEYAGPISDSEHIQPVPEQTLSRTGRINYLA